MCYPRAMTHESGGRAAGRRASIAMALASISALALTACASQAPLLATDGAGNYVFGSVLRSWESSGAANRRLADRASSLCGGDGTYVLRIVYGPPGQTPPLVFEEQPSQNNFRSDIVEYGVVGCKNGAPTVEGVPRVDVVQGYGQVSDDLPAVPASDVEVIEERRENWPPSAIESIETHLKPPYEAGQILVKLTPDYPTATDPDRLLGFFDVGVLQGDEEARAIGGKHGANVLLKEKDGVYLAFHISRAYPSVDDALARLDLPKGWTASQTSKFDDPTKDGEIEIEGAVGKCYFIAGALGPDATLKKRVPALLRTWEGKLGVLYPDDVPQFGKFEGRSFLSRVGCPTVPAKIGLKVRWTDAGGKGSYELRVYSRAVTAKERTDIQLYATQKTCGECGTDRLACLSKAGLSESACTTALRSDKPATIGGLLLDGYR